MQSPPASRTESASPPAPDPANRGLHPGSTATPPLGRPRGKSGPAWARLSPADGVDDMAALFILRVLLYCTKLIHPKAAGGAYEHHTARDDSTGGAAAQRRQKQIWKEYRDKMRQKDREHFGIQEGGKGPLESIFSQSDFQGLAVGTYGEISSNVRKMVSIAVEYGYKHLGASILASDLDAVKNSIRRRFHTTIAMASWRGYANMLLGRIQYVGKAYAFNKVQRQYRLVEHLDQGAFGSWSCAHLMDRPLPDLHPSGWAY